MELAEHVPRCHCLTLICFPRKNGVAKYLLAIILFGRDWLILCVGGVGVSIKVKCLHHVAFIRLAGLYIFNIYK